jgi:hypothetical protein
MNEKVNNKKEGWFGNTLFFIFGNLINILNSASS